MAVLAIDASWRDRLKTGPLRQLYAHTRWLKRRLRSEPLAGYVRVPFPPMPIEQLRCAARELPNQARIYYSLGLGYLATEQPDDVLKALAALRCAETLKFESPERIALYKAVVASRRGQVVRARELTEAFLPHELTDEENALLAQVRIASMTTAEPLVGPEWQAAGHRLEAEFANARTCLVIGDSAGISADWLPYAGYLLVGPDVTGLSVSAVAALGYSFDVGVAIARDRTTADEAGVRCANWVILGDR